MSSFSRGSPFRPGRLSKIWLYLVDRLKNDAQLRSCVDDWDVRTGVAQDAAPNITDRVCLMLRTSGGALRWTDELRHGGQWNITLDLIIPTTDEVWALDAWEAIYNAIPYPNLPAHYQAMVIEGGCFEIVMIGPAFQRMDSAGAEAMKISGQIQLLFNVKPY